MDLATHPDIALIRDHLIQHLGMPAQVLEVTANSDPRARVQALYLAYFEPQGPRSAVYFSTCGAGLYRMRDGRRVEGLMRFARAPLPQAFDSIYRVLSGFAVFPEQNGEVVRVGDTIEAANELKGLCDMDALLFMPPVPMPPAFHRVQITGDESAEFLWLLPVYRSEAEYALRHDLESLMILFRAQGIDVLDMARVEANTMMTPEDAKVMAPKAKAGAAPRPSNGTAGPAERAYEVEEGATVRIARRGTKPPKPAPADPQAETQIMHAAQPPPEPARQPPPEERTQQMKAARPPPPRRAPVEPPEPKEPEVRFDLSKVKREPEPPPSPPKRAPKPVVEEVDPAEAKRRRIAELKQKAQDARARARARQTGEMPAAQAPAPEQERAGSHLDAAKAAAKRRGAPRRAIEVGLDPKKKD